jgi:hypothetical protein
MKDFLNIKLTRKQYWRHLSLLLLLMVGGSILFEFIPFGLAIMRIIALISFLLIVAGRLKMLNQNPWWCLFSFIPFFGIVYLVIIGVVKK